MEKGPLQFSCIVFDAYARQTKQESPARTHHDIEQKVIALVTRRSVLFSHWYLCPGLITLSSPSSGTSFHPSARALALSLNRVMKKAI